MKQQYERSVLSVTRFADEDVIVTSEYGRNNAYRGLSELNDDGSRVAPNR